MRQENGTGENRKKKEGKGKTVVGKRKNKWREKGERRRPRNVNEALHL